MVIINDYIINNLVPNARVLTVGSRAHYHWWIKINLEDGNIYDSGLGNALHTPHPEWIAQAKTLVLAEFEKLKKLKVKHCFVRFGKPPEGGKSYNFRDHHHEPGVSVYPAFIIGNEVRLDLTNIDFTSYLFISNNSERFFCEGEIVGTGSDGEPCLRVTKTRKITKKYSLTVA